MKSERCRPAWIKIIFTDYWCMLLFLIPTILVVILGWIALSGRLDSNATISLLLVHPDRDAIFLAGSILLIIIAPLLLLLRVGKIQRIFREGIETEGMVVFFREFKDRGRIEFES
mgnify:FL=1